MTVFTLIIDENQVILNKNSGIEILAELLALQYGGILHLVLMVIQVSLTNNGMKLRLKSLVK